MVIVVVVVVEEEEEEEEQRGDRGNLDCLRGRRGR
jgi:hypothetical protein